MLYRSHFWKKVPFLKLLLAFAGGIITQWYYPANPLLGWYMIGAGTVVLVFIYFISLFHRYRWRSIFGLVNLTLFFSMGMLMSYAKDIRHARNGLGNHYTAGDALIVTIDEPPVEKIRSFKTNAKAVGLIRGDRQLPVSGKIIIYFSKDSFGDSIPTTIGYGKQIVFKRALQQIKSAGNPGGFDYKRYALFQGITHQVFLQPGEFEILPGHHGTGLRTFLYHSREKLLGILRQHIHGTKELGLAEALLIGYKQDLDPSLVQSYTNTGVVHIIAISGLHLGLIYWLMALLLRPLQRTRWIRTVLIITVLWLFSLLAGAQPSILRSALMFTCIVLGEGLSRKTSVYNTMAVSAFILLCINPFWLWDVGFQLSYSAVLSIIIFMHPIYNLLYIPNKVLDFVWKMNAVTLAAQILTVPVSIYHFHQFPNLFILTNLIAVPLSSIILLGEIFLCIVSFIPPVAEAVGNLLSWLIGLMNGYIERVGSIPYSVWDGLQISLLQAILLLVIVAALARWLMEGSRSGLYSALVTVLAFLFLRSVAFISAAKQQKLIIYNVPKKTAIDIISGRRYLFAGDSSLITDEYARNFHLKPSRILHRVSPGSSTIGATINNNCWTIGKKHILFIDQSAGFHLQKEKTVIDLLIVSGNPRLDFKELAASLDLRQVVLDGSVPAWKITQWEKDCDSLLIPCHAVTSKGAFVMNLR